MPHFGTGRGSAQIGVERQGGHESVRVGQKRLPFPCDFVGLSFYIQGLKIGINSHDLQTSFWKLARLPCHGEESLLSRGSG
jgi:hypothetical protein